MTKFKPSVVVLVCAYNEEKNIYGLLASLKMQKVKGFILDKILVISDGSSDSTVKIAKSLPWSKIEIVDYQERVGKSTRLTQVYNRAGFDILVQTDADVIFSHPYVLTDIIRPLQTESDIAMSGGNPKPISGSTFVERAVNCSVEAYLTYRTKIKNGHNIFSADGRLIAFKRKLFSKIVIPPDMIANDAFTYFYCLNEGFAYNFVESAIVYYRSPQTIADQIRQNTRFVAAHSRLSKYFPSNLVSREYQIPIILGFKSMFIQFFRSPFECTFIFIVNCYSRIAAFFKEPALNAKWDIAFSTKRL